jgi:hypothetical protein
MTGSRSVAAPRRGVPALERGACRETADYAGAALGSGADELGFAP